MPQSRDMGTYIGPFRVEAQRENHHELFHDAFEGGSEGGRAGEMEGGRVEELRDERGDERGGRKVGLRVVRVGGRLLAPAFGLDGVGLRGESEKKGDGFQGVGTSFGS